MLKWILLALTPILSFALEISIDSAKDNFTKYATLHLNNNDNFTCKELRDEFNEPTEVVCAFSKNPLKNMEDLEDDFFKVHGFIKKETFFISIKPKYKIRLFSNIFDLTQDDTLFSADASLGKHWFIVGYKDKFPLINDKKSSEYGLNFPIYIEEDKLPYVGSLDLKGNPIEIKSVDDVKEYIRIKKYFGQKEYGKALESIEEILDTYPNTLFKAELLYYKIVIFSHQRQYESLIENAKVFLYEYSADDNTVEILSLLANAYAKTGMNSNADYFFDRLFSEHPESKFAQMGYIYKGESLQVGGGDSLAESYYKRALYETKDIDVAVLAADRLAELKFESNPKAASVYMEKILGVKPEYFLENLQRSMSMMRNYADAEEFQTAADIANALLKGVNPSYDEYEELLALKGLYLANTEHKKEALRTLTSYTKKFPDGDYLSEVEFKKDQLFFDVDELNTTAMLEEYDTLMEEYQNDPIAQRALYEKAKLLNKLKKYIAVLSMKYELESLDPETYTDIPSIIYEAVKGAMESSLDQKDCETFLVLSNEYNASIDNRYDEQVYICAYKSGEYTLAEQMIDKHLSTNDIKEKELWLYRDIEVEYTRGEYETVIKAAKDLIALLEIEENKEYKDVYRILFDGYERLHDADGMLESIVKLEELYPDSYIDLDRYANVVALGVEKKDDNLVIRYGKKIYDLQQKTASFAQSPYIEFTLYQAYIEKEDYRKALEVIKSLDDTELKDTQRARQKYLLGFVYSKLWKDEQAKKAYEEAIQADEKSAWGKLAQSAKEL